MPTKTKRATTARKKKVAKKPVRKSARRKQQPKSKPVPLIRDRIVELARVPGRELLKNAANYRTHPKEQRDAINGVLAEIGIADALIGRKTRGRIELIDGHLRVEEKPDVDWPVLVLNVTKKEADQLLATLDPMSAMASVDRDLLKGLLGRVKFKDDGTQAMLDALAKANDIDLSEGDGELIDPPADIDHADQLRRKWKVKKGQLWEITGPSGLRHRLLCGDATNADNVKLLTGGIRVSCMFIDPPYNVASDSKNFAANASKSMADLESSDWDHEFDVASVFGGILRCLDIDGSLYWCVSHFVAGNVWAWMSEWSTHSSWCIWVKPNPMPSLSKRHWTWNAELIAYATRGRHVFNFPSDGHAPCVWTFNKRKSTQHPTEKVVDVPAMAIRHSSCERGDVADLFLGSGTTMVAAEQLGRRCFGMEISPKYVAVALDRMKQIGCEATLA